MQTIGADPGNPAGGSGNVRSKHDRVIVRLNGAHEIASSLPGLTGPYS